MLPLLYPAIGGAALLTFMTSLGSFSAPYIFGGGFRVMTTQIVATRLNGDNELGHGRDDRAHAARAGGARGSSAAATRPDAPAAGRKGAAPGPRSWCESPALRLASAVLAWGLAGLLLLPHLTLLLVSFVPVGTWTVEPMPPVYTCGTI